MIDTILGGRYKLIEKVGVGGMAYVYRAQDQLLKRTVAVKILKDQYVEDEDFLRKFENEAQSAARLSHPNIVNVFDVGADNESGKDIHYIVMEYLDGETLKDYIERKGPLSNEEITNFSLQIAKALECAHTNGIIHRDIKPQNIMISSFGSLKVTDFGIARLSTSATITYTSSILGTVHYISPEQAKGKFIDEKSDIYSLGIVMYEMATGRVPFDAENPVGIAIKHIQEPIEPPQNYNPHLSEKLATVILTCLQKEPVDRFASCAVLVKALESPYGAVLTQKTKFADDTMKISKTPEPEAPKKKAIYRSRQNISERRPEKPRRSHALTIVAVICAFIVVGGAFLLLNRNKEPEIPEVATAIVPDVVQKSEREAIELIEEVKLVAKVTARKPSDEVETDHVISQTPDGEVELKEGDTVELTISTGKEMTSVPNLVDKAESELQSLLDAGNLGTVVIRREFDDDVPEGRVISQEPKANEQVAVGTDVVVIISKGKERVIVEMPELSGSDLNKALELLRSSNLVPGRVDYREDPVYPKDTVFWQSKIAGSEVEEGTVIDLLISSGPKQTEPQTETPPSNERPSELPSEPKKVYHKFTLNPPEDRDSYVVTIKKITDQGAKEIYNQEHRSSDGVQTVTLLDEPDGKFEVYYDGEIVSTMSE